MTSWHRNASRATGNSELWRYICVNLNMLWSKQSSLWFLETLNACHCNGNETSHIHIASLMLYNRITSQSYTLHHSIKDKVLFHACIKLLYTVVFSVRAMVVFFSSEDIIIKCSDLEHFSQTMNWYHHSMKIKIGQGRVENTSLYCITQTVKSS